MCECFVNLSLPLPLSLSISTSISVKIAHTHPMLCLSVASSSALRSHLFAADSLSLRCTVHCAVCTHLFSTYFLKASRKMSLRLLIIGKSRARCSSFCSFSLKPMSSISFANPMPFAPFLFAAILFFGDFNGNEMLNTTIINNTYRQTVSFIEAVHGGIDFNRFVHLIVEILITASVYQWHTKYECNFLNQKSIKCVVLFYHISQSSFALLTYGNTIARNWNTILTACTDATF